MHNIHICVLCYVKILFLVNIQNTRKSIILHKALHFGHSIYDKHVLGSSISFTFKNKFHKIMHMLYINIVFCYVEYNKWVSVWKDLYSIHKMAVLWHVVNFQNNQKQLLFWQAHIVS